jgi:alditol oxidase
VRNWAGNLEYRAARLHEPTSTEQLQDIVQSSPGVRALGSRHSFHEIADTTGDTISLARLPRLVEIDADARTATIDGGIRYGELCQPLHDAGFAIHNLASLPHISVAGACATGTHGSGDTSGSLATAITAMDVVTADGEIATFRRSDDPDPLAGAAVSLGALGIVSGLSLEIEPAFQVRQDVYEDLPLDAMTRHFDELTASADSVSFFTEWRGSTMDQGGSSAGSPMDRRSSRRRCCSEPHGQRRIAIRSGESRQPRARPNSASSARGTNLPHFRMDHTPSNGDELQSEYLVPREHAVDALLALHAIRDRIRPLIQVSELRTVAPDLLWLSMAHGRASAAFHFTWVPDRDAVDRLLPRSRLRCDPSSLDRTGARCSRCRPTR